MSVTMDDLMLIFDNAYCANLDNPATKISSDRAGVKAVVLALRDELLRKEGPDTHNLSERIGLRVAVKMFNDILGDAGEKERHLTVQEQDIIHSALRRGVKAAGGPTREDGPDVVISSVQTPAADPSPAVCEWRMVGKTFANAGCEDEYLWSHEYKACPSCGKPIAFKEAK